MINEGYQPNKGKLDVNNPPKGGSGIPKYNYNPYKTMWEYMKAKYGAEYIIFEGGDSVGDVMKEIEKEEFI